MREIKKIVFFLILIAMLFVLPSICKATDHTVGDETTFRSTVESSVTGDAIILTDNIVLTSPVTVTNKTITINGNSHTIRADDTWTSGTQGNQSLITISTGANVTLKNITVRDSKKYGVQAYDTGYAILDGVNLVGNKYGGAIVNGGNLEIVNVTLGKNGENGNVGIEIAKGTSAQRDPILIMNGKLTSSEPKNVLWIAQNDQLNKFTVENTEESEQKLLSTGDQIFVADQNNEILYASNVSEKEVEISPDNSIESAIITIHYEEETIQMAVDKGDTLESLDLTAIKEGVEGKEFVEFRVGNSKGKVFSEETEITENLDLFAVYKEIKKDTLDKSDKTGIENTEVMIAIIVAMISLVGLAELKKNK